MRWPLESALTRLQGVRYVAPVTRDEFSSASAAPALVGSVIMTLRSNCPHCRSAQSFPEELAGETVRCRECGHSFTAPDTAPLSLARNSAAPLELGDSDDDEGLGS